MPILRNLIPLPLSRSSSNSSLPKCLSTSPSSPTSSPGNPRDFTPPPRSSSKCNNSKTLGPSNGAPSFHSPSSSSSSTFTIPPSNPGSISNTNAKSSSKKPTTQNGAQDPNAIRDSWTFDPNLHFYPDFPEDEDLIPESNPKIPNYAVMDPLPSYPIGGELDKKPRFERAGSPGSEVQSDCGPRGKRGGCEVLQVKKLSKSKSFGTIPRNGTVSRDSDGTIKGRDYYDGHNTRRSLSSCQWSQIGGVSSSEGHQLQPQFRSTSRLNSSFPDGGSSEYGSPIPPVQRDESPSPSSLDLHDSPCSSHTSPSEGQANRSCPFSSHHSASPSESSSNSALNGSQHRNPNPAVTNISPALIQYSLPDRISYLTSFLGFGEADVKRLNKAGKILASKKPQSMENGDESDGNMGDGVEGRSIIEEAVDEMYEKLFGFDITKKIFMTRTDGFEGELPQKLDDLTLESEQIKFRKIFMKVWTRRILMSDYKDQETWAYMDKVGQMHTGVHTFKKHKTLGNPPLYVPYRDIALLLGFCQNIIQTAIFSLPNALDNESEKMGMSLQEKIETVSAVSKVIWIQNDLFSRHYIEELDR